jgi:beta-glucosidase/6-phospho-beta-glucosidase/beta-galactosidase
VSGTGPFIAPGIEFSDSGRAIYPDGLYHTLWSFHQRYNTPRKTNVRFVVTENGIADDKDVLRPAYMVEHLLAVFAARQEVSQTAKHSEMRAGRIGAIPFQKGSKSKRCPTV